MRETKNSRNPMANSLNSAITGQMANKNIKQKLDEYGWLSFFDLPPSSSTLAVKKQAIIKIKPEDHQTIVNKKITMLKGTFKQRKKKTFEQKTINQIRIVRVCDCPNQNGQYNLLIEWKFNQNFIYFESIATESGQQIHIQDQIWNYIIISPGEPNSSPPPSVEGRSTPPSDIDTTNSNRLNINDILAFYERENMKINNKVTIAILDTGLKYYLPNSTTGDLRKYPKRRISGSIVFPVSIIKNSGCADYRKLGYNSVTDYIDSQSPRRTLLGITSISGNDALYNPYDDHKIIDDYGRTIHGRHGTTVSAIIHSISEEVSKIIPVKTFNNAGFGTLFDILCAFRYVINRKRSEPTIRIINCSWIAYFSTDSKPLEWLREVFVELQKEQIFVVSAAGNRLENSQQGNELGENLMLYPACFSNEFDNVITVTTAIGDTPTELAPYENYNRDYVDIAVVTNDGSYSSPFTGGENITGSSFGTAFISGDLANYLANITDGNKIDFLRRKGNYSGSEFKTFWPFTPGY